LELLVERRMLYKLLNIMDNTTHSLRIPLARLHYTHTHLPTHTHTHTPLCHTPLSPASHCLSLSPSLSLSPRYHTTHSHMHTFLIHLIRAHEVSSTACCRFPE